MKYVRFRYRGAAPRWGLLSGDEVVPLRRDPFHDYTDDLRTGTRLPLAEVMLAAPVDPPRIFGVGLNYTDHADELGMERPAAPVIFWKSPSAVIGPGEKIIIPHGIGRVDYEAELAAVIGTGGWRIPEADALAHVLGYTCLNDVTARDLQKRDGQWTCCKSYPTFCPVGPWVVGGIDPAALTVELAVDGQVKQHARTDHLVFSVAAVIAHVSAVIALQAGDVIATGTPVGVGALRAGNTVRITIAQIGTLENPVVQEGDTGDEYEV